jgi:hypothetical protein
MKDNIELAGSDKNTWRLGLCAMSSPATRKTLARLHLFERLRLTRQKDMTQEDFVIRNTHLQNCIPRKQNAENICLNTMIQRRGETGRYCASA